MNTSAVMVVSEVISSLFSIWCGEDKVGQEVAWVGCEYKLWELYPNPYIAVNYTASYQTYYPHFPLFVVSAKKDQCHSFSAAHIILPYS